MASSRRRLRGLVASNSMDKTVVVEVARTKSHPVYRKVIRIKKRYLAHDAENSCQVGDRVVIVESRPLSRKKRWVVEAILERAEG